MTTQTALQIKAAEALRVLHEAGYEAFLVGGYVRDFLLGLSPHDVDIATSATPTQIQSAFSSYPHYLAGERHGTVGVVMDGEKVEITTYRAETYDGVTRHPVVRFGVSLREDLSRRDFTVNALAMSADGAVIDYHGGARDLAKGLIHVVEGSANRFHEDPLRLMRAVRLAAQLQFAITPTTVTAIIQTAGELRRVSRERVRDELNKTLLTREPGRGLSMLESLTLLPHVIPELQEGVGIHQTYPHHKDVFGHTILVLEGAAALTAALTADLTADEENGAGVNDRDGIGLTAVRRGIHFQEAQPQPALRLRLAALLHDVAKPRTKSVEGGTVHFYRHEYLGAEMALNIMEGLRYRQKEAKEVARLVELHMRPNLYERSFRNAAVRRLVRDAGELLPDLLSLSRCDITGQRAGRLEEALGRLDHLRARTEEVGIVEAATVVSPLDGKEIMEILGIGPGPEVGRVKRALEEAVVAGAVEGVREAAAFVLAAAG